MAMLDFLKISKLSIAHKAAEIIMEEGVTDYLFAKKKAAKYLGCLNNQALPSNKLIDEAIKEYQSIYLDEASPELLRKIKNEGYKSIAVAKIPNKGLGKTINDRLSRASKL